ncbi:MAG TPA: nucleotidyltransferase family protein [Pseudomonadales bacterium]|nr:nucleotidyltransferase family protein [Pseudomonadales bacterium]
MIGCLILAAGSHRRFGAAKLLHPLADGRPLIQHSLRQIQASGLPMALVHRPDDGALLQAVNGFALQWVASHDHYLGLGHSIAAGVAATAHWQGWLICLADMPCIQADTFRLMGEALQHNALVIPEYNNQLGHPRGFQSQFRTELMQLQGDFGARDLLSRNKNVTFKCRVNDPGILLDVDRLEDLPRLSTTAPARSMLDSQNPTYA